MLIKPVIDISGSVAMVGDKKYLLSNIMSNDFRFGISNRHTHFPFRIGYFIWTLNGSNTLKSLNHYGNCMDEYTDDGETLRGAYGPRMRFWVGADQLQEAINVNMNIDNPEDYVKPAGVDQLEACYNDLVAIGTGVINIFDPSIDFDSSNHIPDMHRISFMYDEDNKVLHVSAIFNNAVLHGQYLNDMFFVMMLQRMMAMLLGCERGTITSISDTAFCRKAYMKMNDVVADSLLDAVEDNNLPAISPEKFWKEYILLKDFEKHLRMQVTEDAHKNQDVSLSMLIEKLTKTYVSKIENSFLFDLAHCLLIIALNKLNTSEYDHLINYSLDSIQQYSLHVEAKGYLEG